jgi:hypothetical protein
MMLLAALVQRGFPDGVEATALLVSPTLVVEHENRFGAAHVTFLKDDAANICALVRTPVFCVYEFGTTTPPSHDALVMYEEGCDTRSYNVNSFDRQHWI